MKTSKLKEYVSSLESMLNEWARKEGIINGKEAFVIAVRLKSSEKIGQMLVEDFFTRERLKAADVSRFIPGRVLNCLHRNLFRHDSTMTMSEFLQKYNVKSLMGWKNSGMVTVGAMVAVIRRAGEDIADPDGLFD